jgi:hypothetical protein
LCRVPPFALWAAPFMFAKEMMNSMKVTTCLGGLALVVFVLLLTGCSSSKPASAVFHTSLSQGANPQDHMLESMRLKNSALRKK